LRKKINFEKKRFLGLNTATAYERAKVSSLSIVGESATEASSLSTVSEAVAVSVSSATPHH
jgi:hypothetical protein